MSGTQQILREYLISLGFKIDKQGEKDFHTTLESGAKKVAIFAKGLMAAAAGIAGMAASFALSMDKLYYASQKANSTAGNLKALEFAGRQIGMTAEAVDSMVQSMVMTLRTDPGMAGWMRSLGVDASEARQGVDIWLDLIDKLREQPFYQGAQFAEMVGMSPDQLLQVEQNLDRFKAAYAERKKMAADSGVDQDKAAEQGRDLANEFGKLSEKFGLWIDKIDSSVLPHMDSILMRMDKIFAVIDKTLRFVTGDLSDKEKSDAADHPWWARHTPDSDKPLPNIPHEPGWMDRLNDVLFHGATKQPAGSPPAASFFAGLEKTFNLAPGTLDHIWKKESNRSDPRFMKSSAGAEGPFGLMPATAKELGVKDPYDFSQSAYAAAKMMSRLRKKYGDDKLALQAYNWGEGNLDRYLGQQAQGRHPKMPNETRRYIDPEMVKRPIYITVTEAKTPMATANAVGKKLDQKMNVSAADQQRYVTGNTR